MLLPMPIERIFDPPAARLSGPAADGKRLTFDWDSTARGDAIGSGDVCIDGDAVSDCWNSPATGSIS